MRSVQAEAKPESSLFEHVDADESRPMLRLSSQSPALFIGSEQFVPYSSMSMTALLSMSERDSIH